MQYKAPYKRFTTVQLVRLGEMANYALEQYLLLVLAERLSQIEVGLDTKIDFNLTQALILLATCKPESAHVYPVSIARQLGMERTRVSHQLRLMVKFGLIRYRPENEGKRSVELTEEGVAVAEVVEKSLEYFAGRLRKGIAKTLMHLRTTALEEIAQRLLKLTPARRRKLMRPTAIEG